MFINCRNAWIVGLGLLVGCSGGEPEIELAPAAGVARFNGNPIADATITFYPEQGPVGVGRTNESGEFQIKTNGRLGAVVGSHRVTVISEEATAEPPPMDGNEMAAAVKSKYSDKYMSPESTDLVITLSEEGDTELVLDLTE